MGPGVIGERLPRDPLHQVTHKAEGYVVVVPAIARSPDLEVFLCVVKPAAGPQVSFYPVGQRDLGVPTLVHPAVPLAVPDGGLVSQKKSEGDGYSWMGRISNRERQVITDVVVQPETALLPQLHQGRGGERLRYGADVLNPVQAHGNLPLQVGESIGIRPNHTVVLDEAGGHPGNVIGGHSLPYERVDLRRGRGRVRRTPYAGKASTPGRRHGCRDEGAPIHFLSIHLLILRSRASFPRSSALTHGPSGAYTSPSRSSSRPCMNFRASCTAWL